MVDEVWTEADAAEFDSFREVLGTKYGTRVLRKLLGLVRGYPKGSGVAVDLGCGTGSYSPQLVGFARPDRLVCVDPSEPMLARARQKFSGPNIEFHAVAAEALSAVVNDARIVLAYNTLDFIRNIDPVFSEVAKVLEPNGVFVFNDRVDNSLVKERVVNGKRVKFNFSHKAEGHGEKAVRTLADNFGFSVRSQTFDYHGLYALRKR